MDTHCRGISKRFDHIPIGNPEKFTTCNVFDLRMSDLKYKIVLRREFFDRRNHTPSKMSMKPPWVQPVDGLIGVVIPGEKSPRPELRPRAAFSSLLPRPRGAVAPAEIMMRMS